MEQEAQAFSPSSLYENGLKMLKYESLLQEFLRFYARHQGTLDLENSILLFQSYRQDPEAGYAQTLEEWNADGRKICYGEKSSLFLYAPKNFQGCTKKIEEREMIPLFTERQTEPCEKYRNRSAEHPFHLKECSEIPKASDEEMLQICVNTAISCMMSKGCGMPIFVEPDTEISLKNPVQYSPNINRLYIAKGAAYDDVAFAIMREVIYSKQFQPLQSEDFYIQLKTQAAYAAQTAAYQMGIEKAFPMKMIAKMPEIGLSGISKGILSLQKDWIRISQQLKQENPQNTVQETPPETEQSTPIEPSEEEKFEIHQEVENSFSGIASEIDQRQEATASEDPFMSWSELFPEDTASPEKNKNWEDALDFSDFSNTANSSGRKRSHAAEL